jgi:SSS family solute:Na+ symporter
MMNEFFMDILVFVAFIVTVLWVGFSKSRKEKTSEDYFLAGRGLFWWLIGFSLIAANISTEQFIGMSGNAASHVGLAIASYEWLAAITLVVVAFGFLPYFLKVGIYTVPEFLEHRYNGLARTIMAVATIFMYLLLLGAVTYSGALTIHTLAERLFHVNVSLAKGSLIIGVIAMGYVVAGGLKACAWADLIQGSALIIGGAIIMFFAFNKLGAATEATYITNVKTGAIAVQHLQPGTGALHRFMELNRVRMNMFLPADDPILPWTALLLGLWIPNFYYWGLNQYITQRTLGSASLAEGQRGIVFAAFMKLIIPFVIVIPGIIAFNLFAGDMMNEAVLDNAPAIARYVNANPETKFVTVSENPTSEAIKNYQGQKFMLAVFDESKAVKNLELTNPRVLPISRTKWDDIKSTTSGGFHVFASDDKAWVHAYPDFETELQTYNQQTREQAAQKGAPVITEKLIAYKYDTAMAFLIGQVLPIGRGVIGFVLAALLGAVVSSLAAMLNAASTIVSMDLFKKYVRPNASQESLVLLGRICVVIFSIVAVVLAPMLGNPKISHSIFKIIQESQGFISPGILAVFVFGLLVRKAPPVTGAIGLITNMAAYGALKFLAPNVQFLNRMAICFGICLLAMTAITLVKPLPQPVECKKTTEIQLETSKGALIAGIVVVALTFLLYLIFSPLGIAR